MTSYQNIDQKYVRPAGCHALKTMTPNSKNVTQLLSDRRIVRRAFFNLLLPQVYKDTAEALGVSPSHGIGGS